MQSLYSKVTEKCESEVLLNEIVEFQEGPGIRNWQFVDKGIPFVNIRCISDFDLQLSNANHISVEEATGKYSHFLLREGDVILSTSGTLGKNAIIRKEHLPLCLNTSIIRFTPINDFDYSFMLCLLRSKKFVDTMYSVATGSAQVNLGPMQLNKITIAVPNEIDRKNFHKLIYPIICEQLYNLKEIRKLKEVQALLLANLAK